MPTHNKVDSRSVLGETSFTCRRVPDPLAFQRATLKSWEWPGDEAMCMCVCVCVCVCMHMHAMSHNMCMCYADIKRPTLSASNGNILTVGTKGCTS